MNFRTRTFIWKLRFWIYWNINRSALNRNLPWLMSSHDNLILLSFDKFPNLLLLFNAKIKQFMYKNNVHWKLISHFCTFASTSSLIINTIYVGYVVDNITKLDKRTRDPSSWSSDPKSSRSEWDFFTIG